MISGTSSDDSKEGRDPSPSTSDGPPPAKKKYDYAAHIENEKKREERQIERAKQALMKGKENLPKDS